MKPTPGQKVDWEDLAWDHGFKGDDRTMLTKWYHKDRLTMAIMGKRLGLCGTTVSRRVRDLGIEVMRTTNYNCGRGPRLPK